MKTISKKQFENAVKRVLNGGTSKMVVTREEKPYRWTKNKGHFNLRGTLPNHSKFLRNDARGGKENDVYLVCYLADGYKIEQTKKEIEAAQKIENEKKKLATAKRKKQADRLKLIAKKHGFASVAELKRAQNEIIEYREQRYKRANEKRMQEYVKLYGEFNGYKVVDRVRLAKLDLIFDCEQKALFY